ncbi:fructokinase [Brevundimonas nasdae]|uniref:ROK family protein n=1 Tax=Brevundimonas nasdae TaxID=172043 RepID=UPI001912C2DD|nr:ROK family protein [Brevundimonas nasdae]MBK6025094.1 ROK family protein [Brevundimonas nasdae]MDQ0451572.1 fructokinase [Brevundimonas nasdae]
MSPSAFLAVETGGTKIVWRIEDSDGAVLDEGRFPSGKPEDVVQGLTAVVAGRGIAAFAIAGFGPLVVDPGSPGYGLMLATPKPGWTGFNLAKALAQYLNAPFAVDTDVNAAAVAEARLGAGRGARAVAYVTVGTGIGGGLYVEGRTLKGALHPEIGHLFVRRVAGDAQPGLCPFHGDCIEGMAAGPAVQARLQGRRLEDAPEVMGHVADYLGQLVASLVFAWAPDRIVFGGGVMSTPGMLAQVEAAARRSVANYGSAVIMGDGPYLAAASLENAGLEGAMLMARDLKA